MALKVKAVEKNIKFKKDDPGARSRGQASDCFQKRSKTCPHDRSYTFDYVSNRIVLDRSSYDFGKPKWHLLETLKVPSTYRGLRLIYKYDDGFHDDFIVSEELNIEYYD